MNSNNISNIAAVDFDSIIDYPGLDAGDPYIWVAEHEEEIVGRLKAVTEAVEQLSDEASRMEMVRRIYRWFGDSWSVADWAMGMGLDLAEVDDPGYVDRWLQRQHRERERRYFV